MHRSRALILVAAAICGCGTHPPTDTVGKGESSNADWRKKIDWASTDWRTILNSPAVEHEAYYRELAEQLKNSLVPTEREAKVLAIRAGVDADARASWKVSGLLRLARPDKTLGEEGDFVWEVRVDRNSNVSGVIWIGATTGKAKVLYPG